MKTLGRTLIIIAVTALVTAALYLVFNSLSSGTPSDFRPGDGQFQPGGSRPDFGAARPDFGGRGPERDGGERGGSVMGLLFGGIKNGLVIGIIVAIIVLPKSIDKRRRLASVKTGAGDSV